MTTTQPSTNRFTHLLATRPWLLADGATGSNLFDMGLMSGDAPELWNTEHPERIAKLHQSFVDAGADIILTNSFGGTQYRLKLHKAQDRVAELNTAAARIAREVADKSGRTVVVAGSIGPTGEIMEPIGPLTKELAQAAFAEQAWRASPPDDPDGAWRRAVMAAEQKVGASRDVVDANHDAMVSAVELTNGGSSPAELFRDAIGEIGRASCRERVSSPV